MNNLFFKLLYFFSITLVISCNNINDTKNGDNKSCLNLCLNIDNYSKEFLSPNSIRINNVLPFIAAQLDVEKVFGKAIKIEDLDKETDLTLFINETQSNLKRFHFKNAIYESNQKVLAFSSINLKNSNISIYHPLIVLNNKTTGLDLFKNFSEHIKSKAFYNRGCNRCSYTINLKASENSDDFWSLIFIRDTLSRIDFHTYSYK